MTLSNAGAPDDTLVAIIVLVIVALLLIGPAFILLYRLQSRRLLGTDEAATLPAAVPADPPEPRASHDARKPQAS